MNGHIDTSGIEISVVIQGPIYGHPSDKNDKRYTQKSIQSVRNFLPKAEIILSTWKDSNTSGLDYDVLVENDDPGTLLMVENGREVYNNVNRQIVSTREGVKRATRKFVLKLRSDVVLTGVDFLKYFYKYELRSPEFRILQNRVLCMYGVNPHRFVKAPYHPSDWYFLGLKQDVYNIWDIGLMDEEHLNMMNEDGLYESSANLAAEQYIWVSFLRKYYKIQFNYFLDEQDDAHHKSDLSQVNNLVFLTAIQLNIHSLKHLNRGHATKGFRRMIFYTHNEWKRLYNRYCGGTLAVVPNLRDYIHLFMLCTVFSTIPLIHQLKRTQPILHSRLRKIYYKIKGLEFKA